MTDTYTQSSWKRPPEIEAVLAVGSLILFAGVTWAIIWHVVPASNEKYAMLMLGALIGVVKDTFGRYFQSTKGAQEQRRQADEVTKTLAVAAASPVTQRPADPPAGDTPDNPLNVAVVDPIPSPQSQQGTLK
jgi:hypothetical protein